MSKLTTTGYQPKNRARLLKKAISEVLSIECKTAQAYEIMAKEDGYSDWNTYSGLLKEGVATKELHADTSSDFSGLPAVENLIGSNLVFGQPGGGRSVLMYGVTEQLTKAQPNIPIVWIDTRATDNNCFDIGANFYINVLDEIFELPDIYKITWVYDFLTCFSPALLTKNSSIVKKKLGDLIASLQMLPTDKTLEALFLLSQNFIDDIQEAIYSAFCLARKNKVWIFLNKPSSSWIFANGVHKIILNSAKPFAEDSVHEHQNKKFISLLYEVLIIKSKKERAAHLFGLVFEDFHHMWWSNGWDRGCIRAICLNLFKESKVLNLPLLVGTQSLDGLVRDFFDNVFLLGIFKTTEACTNIQNTFYEGVNEPRIEELQKCTGARFEGNTFFFDILGKQGTQSAKISNRKVWEISASNAAIQLRDNLARRIGTEAALNYLSSKYRFSIDNEDVPRLEQECLKELFPEAFKSTDRMRVELSKRGLAYWKNTNDLNDVEILKTLSWQVGRNCIYRLAEKYPFGCKHLDIKQVINEHCEWKGWTWDRVTWSERKAREQPVIDENT